jgi:DNA-binding NtrC family response regulator
VALSPGGIIPADALLLDAGNAEHLARPADPGRATAATLTPAGHDLTLQAAERRHIQHILEMMGGNKRRAARALGVSRPTLGR